jgi:hypothetical protein
MSAFSLLGYSLLSFKRDSRAMATRSAVLLWPEGSARKLGALALSGAALLLLTLSWASVAHARSGARPAGKSQHAAIVAAFKAGDGNPAEVHGVFVSRSHPGLAVVCVHTPEAGKRAFVFALRKSSWRYVTSGLVGRAGNSTQRALERACG